MNPRDMVGVVIGRFQVDDLHRGHKAMLDHVASLHYRMLVLVGTRDTPPTSSNPLAFEIREKMLRAAYPQAIVAPIEDCRTDEQWSEKVDDMIRQIFGHIPAILYCGRDGFRSNYLGKYEVSQFHSVNDEVKGSTIRHLIGKNPDHDAAFRRGAIYAMENLWPRIFLTTDMAMVQSASSSAPTLLVVRKPFGQAWQLPGGFVELGESFRDAAVRELFEETALLPAGAITFVGDFSIPDWRLRGTKNVSHTTVLMRCEYGHGAPRPQDDIIEVDWFDLKSFKDNETFFIPEHRPLVEAIYKQEIK